jgi:hypothetical protein
MYWTTAGSRKLHRIKLDGTGVQTVVGGMSNPIGVTLDASGAKVHLADNGSRKTHRPNCG